MYVHVHGSGGRYRYSASINAILPTFCVASMLHSKPAAILHDSFHVALCLCMYRLPTLLTSSMSKGKRNAKWTYLTRKVDQSRLVLFVGSQLRPVAITVEVPQSKHKNVY